MATPEPEQRKQQLFQSKALTALFGPGIATMVTRIVVVLVAVGTLAIITVGLLRPNTSATTTSTAGSSPSHSNVGLLVGNMAPNFTLTSLDGKLVSLSDYRAKPVMLNFWYATCPGCLAEIPGMQKYYASQYAAGKDLVILGVNIVDDAQTAAQFVHQHGLTYPVVLDQNQQILALYRVNVTPTSYFIDRQGIIRVVVPAPVDDAALQQDVAQIS
jgi:peroxiredoxin